MAHATSKKYTNAWQKLAQYVATGQKERALGVCKILSLSMSDSALMHQLEGDIQCAFENPGAAAKCYLQAAKFYQRDNKPLEAALIFDHLTLLQPTVTAHIKSALELYKKLQHSVAIKERSTQLVNTLIKAHQWKDCYDTIKTANLDNTLARTLMQKLLYELISSKIDDTTEKIAIDLVTHLCQQYAHEKTALHELLAHLETTAPFLHDHACTLVPIIN